MDNFLTLNTFQRLVDRRVFPNGLRLLTLENNISELVSIQLWIKTGSIFEAPLLGTGVSHFVEHMVFKGTKTRTYDTIASAIQEEGASINAYTTFDHTVYHIEGISSSIEILLEILSDMIFNSIFLQTDFEIEKNVILRELEMDINDPESILNQAVFETAFREHPYKYPVIGKKELFDKLTREDLLYHYKKNYVPNNMTLVIIGNIKTDKTVEFAKNYFGKYEYKNYQQQIIEKEPRQLICRKQRLFGDYSITRGAMAFKIPDIRDIDSPGLDLLARVLGGGNSSILHQKLYEEKHLVYSVNVESWNPKDIGLFWITYHCDLDKRQTIEDEILLIIKQIQKHGFDKCHLERALQQSIVQEINGLKTITSQTSRIGTAEVVFGDYEYPVRYISLLQNETYENVHSLIAKYLVPENLTMVSLESITKKFINIQETKPIQTKDEFEQIDLPNGIPLLLQTHSYFPKAHLQIAFRGGTMFESADEFGISKLLSDMIIQDTTFHSRNEIAKALESSGSSFFSFSGNNMFGLKFECLSNQLKNYTNIIKNALLHPAILPDTFFHTKSKQIAIIQDMLDDPISAAVFALRKRFFGKHPYAHCSLGTIETVNNLTTESLNIHKNKMISNSNVVFACSGLFDREFAIDFFSEIALSFPKNLDQNYDQFSYDQFQTPAQTGVKKIKTKSKQAFVLKGYPSFGYLNQDFFTTEIFVELMNGISSELFQSIRDERGLAYFIETNRIIGTHSSMLYMIAGTTDEHQIQISEIMENAIRKIANQKLSSKEFQIAKNHLKVSKSSYLQTANARCSEACLGNLYGLKTNHWKSYNDQIEKVSLDKIFSFANEILSPEKSLTLFVSS